MSSLANPLAEVVGLTILHSLWQITLLWIVLVAVLRLCPKASSAVRYTFAISILMLSVLTTAATAVYEWQLHAPIEEVSALPNGTTQTVDIVNIPVSSRFQFSETFLFRIVDAVNSSAPLLAWLWCAGLVVMCARFGGSFFYLGTLRREANISAMPPAWEQELKRLSMAVGLKCRVGIASSARVSSPLTLGSISPIILVPAALLSGLSAEQIEAILVHELYHIKRRDYIVNICQALVEVLLFYHPVLWQINNIIREERENCCDDKTVAFCGSVMEYARALTHIQEIDTLTKPTLAMSATGRNAGHFTNRIQRLFHIYPGAGLKGMFAVGFLIIYLCIVLAGANVLTAQGVKLENKPMTTNASDFNTFGNIFQDTIPVRYVLDGKEITRQQLAATAVKEQGLAPCLEHADVILKMVSLYRVPGEGLRFSKFSAEDSLQLARSMDYLTKYCPMVKTVSIDTLNLQQTRTYGTVNLSISKLD